MEPIFFNDTNLLMLGKKNLDHVQYAIYLTRYIFSDAELKNHSFLPKKINSKPTLDIGKSNLIKQAVLARFQLAEDSDVSPGKRQRTNNDQTANF